MNCVEFGFDRSRGFGSARGQVWPIAIDRPTRPYNIASTTVHQVIDVDCRQLSLIESAFYFHFKRQHINNSSRRFCFSWRAGDTDILFTDADQCCSSQSCRQR
jgi:hypothetical protein